MSRMVLRDAISTCSVNVLVDDIPVDLFPGQLLYCLAEPTVNACIVNQDRSRTKLVILSMRGMSAYSFSK